MISSLFDSFLSVFALLANSDLGLVAGCLALVSFAFALVYKMALPEED